jgi:TPR repeat protein
MDAGMIQLLAIAILFLANTASAYTVEDDLYKYTDEELKKHEKLARKSNDARELFTIGYAFYTHRLKNPEGNDMASAKKFFKMAAARGSLPAMVVLGKYLISDGSKNQGVELISKAGKQQHPLALYELGLMYERGVDMVQDLPKAFEYFRAAEKAGFKEAEIKLAKAYAGGIGTTRNYKLAIYYYSKLSERATETHDKILYAYRIAGMYAAMDQNLYATEIFKWIKISGELGDTYGQIYMANAYSKGKGVEINNQEAMKWFLLAAATGSVPAMEQIGYSYANGTMGNTRDYRKSVEWYTKAAESGSATAAWNLGYIYKNGYGVAKNQNEARRWFARSATLTSPDEKKKAIQESIKKRISSEASQDY